MPENPDPQNLFNTPDITPAQIGVAATALIAVLVSFGVDINTTQQVAVIALVTIIGSFALWADAKIRHGRATGSAQRKQ